MPKFASQIDTMGIPTKGLTPEQVTSFPSGPWEGRMVHRTDVKMFYMYLNGGWVQCDNQGTAAASHIHAIADVTGLSAAIAAKADAARTITAGTGLTGGGDLTANRTLAVSYGTAAGTALQGNTRLDQVTAPTAPVSMNAQRVTNVADPTAPTDAANKQYVDAARAGMDVKESVRLATTGNITLSGAQNIDGVAVVTGNRILVKDQGSGQQNGIYIANTSGAWTRSPDANTATDLNSGAFTFVEEGTVNQNTGWVMITDGNIVWDTTIMTWAQFSGVGALVAGAGLTKTGSTVDAVGTANRIQVNADSIDIASTYAGQTSITTVGSITTGAWNGTAISTARGGTGATDVESARGNLSLAPSKAYLSPALTAGVWSSSLAHNFNGSHVHVSCNETASGESIELDWRVVDANNVQIRSDVAFGAGAIRVLVTADA